MHRYLHVAVWQGRVGGVLSRDLLPLFADVGPGAPGIAQLDEHLVVLGTFGISAGDGESAIWSVECCLGDC